MKSVKQLIDAITVFEQKGDWTIKGCKCITPDGVTHEGKSKVLAMEKAISYWRSSKWELMREACTYGQSCYSCSDCEYRVRCMNSVLLFAKLGIGDDPSEWSDEDMKKLRVL